MPVRPGREHVLLSSDSSPGLEGASWPRPSWGKCNRAIRPCPMRLAQTSVWLRLGAPRTRLARPSPLSCSPCVRAAASQLPVSGSGLCSALQARAPLTHRAGEAQTASPHTGPRNPGPRAPRCRHTSARCSPAADPIRAQLHPRARWPRCSALKPAEARSSGARRALAPRTRKCAGIRSDVRHARARPQPRVPVERQAAGAAQVGRPRCRAATKAGRPQLKRPNPAHAAPAAVSARAPAADARATRGRRVPGAPNARPRTSRRADAPPTRCRARSLTQQCPPLPQLF
jgi:hypothetical protein